MASVIWNAIFLILLVRTYRSHDIPFETFNLVPENPAQIIKVETLTANHAVQLFVTSLRQFSASNSVIRNLYNLPLWSQDMIDEMFQTYHKPSMAESWRKYRNNMTTEKYAEAVDTTVAQILQCKDILTPRNADELVKKYQDVLLTLADSMSAEIEWKSKLKSLVQTKMSFMEDVGVPMDDIHCLFEPIFGKVLRRMTSVTVDVQNWCQCLDEHRDTIAADINIPHMFSSHFWDLVSSNDLVLKLFNLPTNSSEFEKLHYKSIKEHAEMIGAENATEIANKVAATFHKYHNVLNNVFSFTNAHALTVSEYLICKGVLSHSNCKELAKMYFDILSNQAKAFHADDDLEKHINLRRTAKDEFLNSLGVLNSQTGDLLSTIYENILRNLATGEPYADNLCRGTNNVLNIKDTVATNKFIDFFLKLVSQSPVVISIFNLPTMSNKFIEYIDKLFTNYGELFSVQNPKVLGLRLASAFQKYRSPTWTENTIAELYSSMIGHILNCRGIFLNQNAENLAQTFFSILNGKAKSLPVGSDWESYLETIDSSEIEFLNKFKLYDQNLLLLYTSVLEKMLHTLATGDSEKNWCLDSDDVFRVPIATLPANAFASAYWNLVSSNDTVKRVYDIPVWSTEFLRLHHEVTIENSKAAGDKDPEDVANQKTASLEKYFTALTTPLMFAKAFSTTVGQFLACLNHLTSDNIDELAKIYFDAMYRMSSSLVESSDWKDYFRTIVSGNNEFIKVLGVHDEHAHDLWVYICGKVLYTLATGKYDVVNWCEV